MIRLIAGLSTIALTCGLLLALANDRATPLIQASQADFETQQLKQIIGQQFSLEKLNSNQYALYEGALNDEMSTAGHLLKVTTPDGYNGEIEFWLGIRDTGEVLGARITRHRETPGLGDKFLLSVSDWILNFNGRTLDNTNWEVRKYGGDIDGFTGATITPRAVVRAIANTLESYPAQISGTDHHE